jgi:hypothetical protein
LEVGEHIPKDYELVFLHNLCSASDNIVLSWAIEGQSGLGHVNCQNNDYIIEKLSTFGYIYDSVTSEEARNFAELPWFKNTLMFFNKPKDEKF